MQDKHLFGIMGGSADTVSLITDSTLCLAFTWLNACVNHQGIGKQQGTN